MTNIKEPDTMNQELLERASREQLIGAIQFLLDRNEKVREYALSLLQDAEMEAAKYEAKLGDGSKYPFWTGYFESGVKGIRSELDATIKISKEILEEA